jgi:hypothetical protein
MNLDSIDSSRPCCRHVTDNTMASSSIGSPATRRTLSCFPKEVFFIIRFVNVLVEKQFLPHTRPHEASRQAAVITITGRVHYRRPGPLPLTRDRNNRAARGSKVQKDGRPIGGRRGTCNGWRKAQSWPARPPERSSNNRLLVGFMMLQRKADNRPSVMRSERQAGSAITHACVTRFEDHHDHRLWKKIRCQSQQPVRTPMPSLVSFSFLLRSVYQCHPSSFPSDPCHDLIYLLFSPCVPCGRARKCMTTIKMMKRKEA